MTLIKRLKILVIAQGNSNMKICGVYKITNTVTGDFYIGSSKNVKSRLAVHKCQSTWKNYPSNQMYLDMMKYGTDKFEFQVVEEVEPEHLKEAEQQFIETLKPTYNDRNANGWDIERHKEYVKEYNKEYHNQLCSYNGENLTLNALRISFQRAGVEHSAKEAKKYLIKKESNNPIEFYDVYP